MDFEAIKEAFEGLPVEDWKKKQEEIDDKKLENEQLIQAYKFIQEHPAGKMVIWDILSRCHIFDCTFTGNSRTFFLEGERSIGLYVLFMLQLGNSLDAIDKLKAIKDGK